MELPIGNRKWISRLSCISTALRRGVFKCPFNECEFVTCDVNATQESRQKFYQAIAAHCRMHRDSFDANTRERAQQMRKNKGNVLRKFNRRMAGILASSGSSVAMSGVGGSTDASVSEFVLAPVREQMFEGDVILRDNRVMAVKTDLVPTTTSAPTRPKGITHVQAVSTAFINPFGKKNIPKRP